MMVAGVEPTVRVKVRDKLRLAVNLSGFMSSTPRPRRQSGGLNSFLGPLSTFGG